MASSNLNQVLQRQVKMFLVAVRNSCFQSTVKEFQQKKSYFVQPLCQVTTYDLFELRCGSFCHA